MTSKAKKAKRILLTGARSPCALELARQLHAAGHQVIAADTDTLHVLRFSNSIEKFLQIPSPRLDPQEFIREINRILEREQIDLLIPVWEEVMYLSFYRNQLARSCELFCAPFELLHQLHNKWSFMKLLETFNIPAPRSQLLRHADDLHNIPFQHPYILKKCFSRGSQSVIKVNGYIPPDMEFDPKNPWMAQEFIEGKHSCSFSICRQGRVLAHAAYPVEYTMDGSSCIAFEAVDDEKIQHWIETFVHKMNYTGQIAFDFIEKPDGQLYAIECNPRITSGIYLFSPKERIDRAYLGTVNRVITPKAGSTKQIATAMLVYGLRNGYQERKTGKYIKKLVSTKDIVFRLRDIKPFLFEFFVFSSYWFKSRKIGKAIPVFFNYDLEWDEDIPNVFQKLDFG